jgi:hypothetical protein
VKVLFRKTSKISSQENIQMLITQSWNFNCNDKIGDEFEIILNNKNKVFSRNSYTGCTNVNAVRLLLLVNVQI